jgi:hypothetical protein
MVVNVLETRKSLISQSNEGQELKTSKPPNATKGGDQTPKELFALVLLEFNDDL